MRVEKLRDFLDQHGIEYVLTSHSPALGRRERIAFDAGSHSELLQLAYADFGRLVQPTVLDFSVAL